MYMYVCMYGWICIVCMYGYVWLYVCMVCMYGYVWYVCIDMYGCMYVCIELVSD